MVLSVELNEKKIVNIIQIYGPVEGAAEEEVLEFYINLQRELDEAREENETAIIMGDWNSRVGKDQNRGMGCMGRYGEEALNKNGVKMIDFCRRNDLIIGNTMWYQNLEDKYTFVAEERNARSLKGIEEEEEDIQWHWLPKHQNAFAKIKEVISKSPALVLLDPTKKIIIQCDASKNGLGSCMFQKHEDALKLVACSSRTMNDHEKNYSQTDKELLAIYNSTQKFHDFIYRSNVDVQTDHNPIVSIMTKPICKIGSNVYARFGYPQYLVPDNLPFISVKFKDYYKEKDITIQTCTPHHHQSNGLAEKAVNIGKQILR
ncbi:RNase H-like domain found in reverse transcriptase [Popillia japonica]|uniref:RNase H-like domain found in reverse transcriptase n=1 Tax=Popillia japonica TaxID=7064 RepID=A0AAW1JN32_POPJA